MGGNKHLLPCSNGRALSRRTTDGEVEAVLALKSIKKSPSLSPLKIH